MPTILNGKKVMLVATNRAVREVLSPIVKQIGAGQVRLSSGPGTIDEFEEFKPDLVFCHDENDAIAAIGVIRIMREKVKTPLSLVLVLNQEESSLGGEALRAGANGILMIPFSVNDVSKLTESILSKPVGGGSALRFGPRPVS